MLDPADIDALANKLDAEVRDMGLKAMLFGIAQQQVKLTSKETEEMLKRIDGITTMMFGETGAQKVSYGMRPIDRVRNRPPAPAIVTGLQLGDGPKPGSLTARWKRQPRASYRVEWTSDPTFESDVQTELSTRRSLTIVAATGERLFVRVRAYRGGQWGKWSASATRIVN